MNIFIKSSLLVYSVMIYCAVSSGSRKYSFVVSIQTKNSSSHLCSGVLLTYKKVLTTCHCVMSREINELGIPFFSILQSEEYVVKAGVSNLTKPNRPKAISRDVARFYPHNNCTFYRNITWIYNYGFAEVDDPFPVDPSVHPIRVFSKSHATLIRGLYVITIKNGICFFAGWNKVQRVNTSNLILTEQTVKLISLDTCSQLLCLLDATRCSYRWAMHGQGCGFITDPVRAGCTIDPGSALVCLAAKSKIYVWGISSWQTDCSAVGIPIVFSTIEFVLSEFIQSVASPTSDFQIISTFLISILIIVELY